MNLTYRLTEVNQTRGSQRRGRDNGGGVEVGEMSVHNVVEHDLSSKNRRKSPRSEFSQWCARFPSLTLATKVALASVAAGRAAKACHNKPGQRKSEE